LGRAALVPEELAPRTRCRGRRVGGKGPAGTMVTAGERRSRAGERKTKRRVTRGRSRWEEAVDLTRTAVTTLCSVKNDATGITSNTVADSKLWHSNRMPRISSGR
jgi:hypothetical protein